MSRSSRPRRWLARTGLALAGLGVGLLLAEGLARVVEPPVGGDMLLPIASMGVPQGLYRPHPRLRSEPTPGFEGVVRSVGHEVPVRINSLGCRGAEPTAGRPRWIAVGDSFTIALQVLEQQSFSARLGALTGRDVLNCGVDGYSTWQALERYRIVDDAAAADGLLLMFFLGNDLADNARAATQQGSEQAPPPPPPPEEPSELERWLISHSYLYGYGHLALARATLRSPDDAVRQRLAIELGIFADQGHVRLQDHLQPTRDAFIALRNEVEQRGDTLLVAVAPPVFAVDEARAAPTLAMVGLEDADPDAPRRAVLKLLEREGIPTCDLTPALQAGLGQGDHPYLLLDGHWSSRGHQLVAQAIDDCIANPKMGERGQP